MTSVVQRPDFIDRFFGFAEGIFCKDSLCGGNTDFQLDPAVLQKEEQEEVCGCDGTSELTKIVLERAESGDTETETDDDASLNEITEDKKATEYKKADKGKKKSFRQFSKPKIFKPSLIVNKLSKKSSKKSKASTAESVTPMKRDSLRAISKSLSVPKINVPKVFMPNVSMRKLSASRLSKSKLSVPKLNKKSSGKSAKSEAPKKRRSTATGRIQDGRSESVKEEKEFAPGRVKEVSSKKKDKRAKKETRAGARRKLSKVNLSKPWFSSPKLSVRAKRTTAPGRIQDGKSDPVKEKSEFASGRIREKRRVMKKIAKPKISFPKLSLRKKNATDGKSKPVKERREKKRVVKKLSNRKIFFKFSKNATPHEFAAGKIR